MENILYNVYLVKRNGKVVKFLERSIGKQQVRVWENLQQFNRSGNVVDACEIGSPRDIQLRNELDNVNEVHS